MSDKRAPGGLADFKTMCYLGFWILVNRIIRRGSDMQRITLCLTIVVFVLAPGASCDSSSGGSSNTITCENLNFEASPFGDLTGTWHASEICVSKIDPAQFMFCASATIDVSMTPVNHDREFRSDNTYSQTGWIDGNFDASVPRTCPGSSCTELDDGFQNQGGSCTETVDACECNLSSTTFLSTGGTWKLESGMLYMRSADASSWDDGQDFFIEGSNLVTKDVSDYGATFTIYRR
jgi:hypothetical protein